MINGLTVLKSDGLAAGGRSRVLPHRAVLRAGPNATRRLDVVPPGSVEDCTLRYDIDR